MTYCYLPKNRDIQISRLQTDIDSLEPKERVKVICDLLPFAVPKLQNIQSELFQTDIKPGATIIFKDFSNPEAMTKEQIDNFIEKL